MSRSVKNSILCWDQDSDRVKILPYPYEGPINYDCNGLASFADVQSMDFLERKMKVFIEAVHLMVRDNVEPKALHRELMKLEEYRSGCSFDMPGMEQYKSETGEWI